MSCQLALKQPLKNKQLIVMPDASLTAAESAIMIEDDPNQKLPFKRKTWTYSDYLKNFQSNTDENVNI